MSSQDNRGSTPTQRAAMGKPASMRVTSRNLRFDEKAETRHKPKSTRGRPASPHPDFINRRKGAHSMASGMDGGRPGQSKHAFLSKPSVILIIWCFLIAVPISYTSALGIKFGIERSGYYLYNDVFFLRTVFIILNFVFILSWAVQLDRETQKARHEMEIAMWDARIEHLEDILATSQAREIEKQLFPDTDRVGNAIEKPRGRALQRVKREV